MTQICNANTINPMLDSKKNTQTKKTNKYTENELQFDEHANKLSAVLGNNSLMRITVFFTFVLSAIYVYSFTL